MSEQQNANNEAGNEFKNRAGAELEIALEQGAKLLDELRKLRNETPMTPKEIHKQALHASTLAQKVMMAAGTVSSKAQSYYSEVASQVPIQ